jgi:hypothetical protein
MSQREEEVRRRAPAKIYLVCTVTVLLELFDIQLISEEFLFVSPLAVDFSLGCGIQNTTLVHAEAAITYFGLNWMTKLDCNSIIVYCKGNRKLGKAKRTRTQLTGPLCLLSSVPQTATS